MKNVFDFQTKKMNAQKISMVTCYDYTSARILSTTDIDCILIGDSAAMTMHGYQHTISANLEMMCFHTSAVARGAKNKFLISDLPFLSYRKSLTKNVNAAELLIKAGAHALKLENAEGNLSLIKHLVTSGIPIMGHLGLTAQLLHTMGGYKVQGKTNESREQLKKDAKKLEEAGCFACVLECIPAFLAKEISESLSIPTIGIGAGPDTDGQVLVFQDLLGLNMDFKPKFVKTYLNGCEQIQKSVNVFVSDINSGEFPHHEHCYNNF